MSFSLTIGWWPQTNPDPRPFQEAESNMDATEKNKQIGESLRERSRMNIMWTESITYLRQTFNTISNNHCRPDSPDSNKWDV